MLGRCQPFGTVRVASRPESLRPTVTIVSGLVAAIEAGRQIPRCRFNLPPEIEGAPLWRSELERAWRIYRNRRRSNRCMYNESGSSDLGDAPRSATTTAARSLAG